MGYLGTKTASGVAEQIISQMPAHEVYVEAFAGRASIFRRKRRAATSILIDVDDEAAWWLTSKACHARDGEAAGEDPHVICDDAVRWLAARTSWPNRPTWLVYCDPPYLRSTRTSSQRYRREFDTVEQHTRLIGVLKRLKCHVMLSGYDSPLYRRLLPTWRKHTYTACTRGGPRTECLWMNFPGGLELHDLRFVGDGFRERERIKRKRRRWVARLAAMPSAERQVIAEALAEVAGVRAASEPAMVDHRRRRSRPSTRHTPNGAAQT